MIDESISEAKLKETAQKNGLGWWEIDNKSLAFAGGVKQRVILTAKGDCDCKTALGSVHHQSKKPNIESEIKKLRKKGWSQSKIDRWKTQKEQSQSRGVSEKEEKINRELQTWENFLNDVFKLKGINNFSILLHCYSGVQEDEVIDILEFCTHKMDTNIKEFLLNMEQDKIYKITA